MCVCNSLFLQLTSVAQPQCIHESNIYHKMDLLRPTASPVFWRRVLFKITSAPQRLEKEIFLNQISVSLLMSLFQNPRELQQTLANRLLARHHYVSFVLPSQRMRSSQMKHSRLSRKLSQPGSQEAPGSATAPPGAVPASPRELWGPHSHPHKLPPSLAHGSQDSPRLLGPAKSLNHGATTE